jgi:hypothetical protein
MVLESIRRVLGESARRVAEAEMFHVEQFAKFAKKCLKSGQDGACGSRSRTVSKWDSDHMKLVRRRTEYLTLGGAGSTSILVLEDSILVRAHVQLAHGTGAGGGDGFVQLVRGTSVAQPSGYNSCLLCIFISIPAGAIIALSEAQTFELGVHLHRNERVYLIEGTAGANTVCNATLILDPMD